MPFFRKPTDKLAKRFLQLFEWHGIAKVHIPRLVPQLTYQDLQTPQSLLPALTPAIIDHTAKLFAVRSSWIESTDDLIYDLEWARDNPARLLRLLDAGIKSSPSTRTTMPLRVVTTSKRLERNAENSIWLLPVIVQAVEQHSDVTLERCTVFANRYDWTRESERLELKALAHLVWERLRTPVPLFAVTPSELEAIYSGNAVPSFAWSGKSLLTEPSLEDFVLPRSQSAQAKEEDELEKLQAYLESSRLRDCWQEDAPSMPSNSATPEAEVSQEEDPAALANHQKPTPRQRMAGGKRQTMQASWDAIVNAAQSLWIEFPNITIAEMVERLKHMPHLKAKSLSDSAIHKHIRAAAPPHVRGKPGRKPNKSA